MAKIAPFRGMRFAPDRVGSYADVVAPPYDVISDRQRASLAKQSPWNIVHADLPIGDSVGRYDAAGRLWRQWLADGALAADPKPALYFLDERFVTPAGQPGVRRGFISVLALEEMGRDTVAPHEKTYAGPKADRLALTRTTRANLSQIFALYRDPEARLDRAAAGLSEKRPDAHVAIGEHECSMWVVYDRDLIDVAIDTLRSSPLTIADGHHRYETALAYRDECRVAGKGDDDGGEAVMVYLSRMDDPDLTILPCHRMVHMQQGFDVRSLVGSLDEFFDVEAIDRGDPIAYISDRLGNGTREPYRMGLFTRESGWKLLELRSWSDASGFIDPGRSEAWRKLDVSVLHEVVLRELATRTAGSDDPVESVRYTTDPDEGREEVMGGTADVFFMVRPTASAQVSDVVQAGDTMPQKSTYFYPKLLTGLVMRSLDPTD